MNKKEANELDKKYNLLPGGQGEHDFCVAHSKVKIRTQLSRYAENCGGLLSTSVFYDTLITCNGEVYHLYYSTNNKRCIKVSKEIDNKEIPYWDERNMRCISAFYQTSNITEPFIEQFKELKHLEKTERSML